MTTDDHRQQATSPLPHTARAEAVVRALEIRLSGARAVLNACRRRDEEREREALGAAYVKSADAVVAADDDAVVTVQPGEWR